MINQDREFMRHALELAALGKGRVSPNPLVGAVIVKNQRIVGEGWHKKAGTPHAEIHALNDAKEKAKGATLYVNLEPCCHTGKTPPCTEAIINAGIKRVVAAMEDPNPHVCGGGFRMLKEAGIDVVCGVMEREATVLNEIFIKNIKRHLPYLILKSAASLDGKTATKCGDSRWITNEQSRALVHRLRSGCDAVLTGIGTVSADDPLLTVRLGEDLPQPLRIVVDYDLDIDPNSRICHTEKANTMIITANKLSEKAYLLAQKGVEIIYLPGSKGRFDLKQLLIMLYDKGIMSILLEAGAELNGAFFAQRLIDKVYLFLAPKLIGGKNAPGILGDAGCGKMADALPINIESIEEISGDLLFTCYPKYN